MLSYLVDPVQAHPDRLIHPVGAVAHDGGVTFRVWAPDRGPIRVVTGDGTSTRYIALEPEPGSEPGFVMGRDDHGREGDLYWLELDKKLAPDPASRFQPQGVEGPSQVVDPRTYPWQTVEWIRPALRGRVIYELHVGAFTREGTFSAAIARLDDLADLGVNTIELMPLGDFPGQRNWGYDGVMIHAPARCYGTPDELRALVDAAHARGLAVMVDVVYNHLGPCGNVLPLFSNHYFHTRPGTLWGAGLNFDEPTAGPVREFFLQNACMWFDEYRIDGLRLDAVHAIQDQTKPHLIEEVAAVAQARGAFVVAEDDRNDARIISPPEQGGWGVDGMWADDFHHTMRVALTGDRHAHFANYSGKVEEWVETLREGWFFHGQYFPSWKAERGTPASHLPSEKFVLCLSNHDQVGNRPLGDRLSVSVTPEVYRAVSVLGCLVPYTPMLFMGQEWAASTPFPYFCHLPGDVGAAMAENRIKEFQHYGALYPPELLARMPDPQAESTFTMAKLDWNEAAAPGHAEVRALYRACLQLRAAYPIFQSPPRSQWSVAAVGKSAIALTWHDTDEEWTLLMGISPGVSLQPPDGGGWQLELSSNEARFGGTDDSKLTGPGASLWRARR